MDVVEMGNILFPVHRKEANIMALLLELLDPLIPAVAEVVAVADNVEVIDGEPMQEAAALELCS